MKLKIERPDYLAAQDGSTWTERFDKWFDENVEPINLMLSEGVEVRSDYCNLSWAVQGSDYYGQEYMTHKALLINIQPIKKERAEDVLRDFLAWDEGDGHDDSIKEIIKRAKAVLGDR